MTKYKHSKSLSKNFKCTQALATSGIYLPLISDPCGIYFSTK